MLKVVNTNFSRLGTIYLLRFPNGKVYVGQTMRSAEQRYLEHKTASKKKARNGTSCALYSAWRKYGDPEIIVLARVHLDDLDSAEIGLIVGWEALAPNGYNMTTGGQTKGFSLADETKDKMSQGKIGNTNGAGNKGIKRSDETKEKMSLNLTGNKRSKGYKWSEERRKAKSELMKGNKLGVGRTPSKEAIENFIKRSLGNTYGANSKGRHVTEETKKKISLAKKGKKQNLSDEQRLILSERTRMRNYGNTYSKGRKIPQSVRDKMSEAQKTRYAREREKQLTTAA